MNQSAFHPEDKARSLIDSRLAACGWLIQSRADMNLGAGLGVSDEAIQTLCAIMNCFACARNDVSKFRRAV
jgi:hypothetical protein